MSRAPGALRPGDIVRIRAERWRIDRLRPHEDARLLDVTGCDQGNTGQRGCFILPHEPIARLDSSEQPRLVAPAHWRHRARRLLARSTPDPRALRAAAPASIHILPFQLEPALAVTHGLGCRLLVADEVGLGKTVQAALVVAEVRARVPDARALVAVPAGLREQWRDELADRFGMPATLIDATRLADGCTDGNPWAVPDVVIASLDYLKRAEVMRALEGLVWDVVVLDEAHALASRSDRARAAALVAARARTVVMLSATPHGGDEAAFGRLCRLGEIGDRRPLLVFRRTRRDAGLAESRRLAWLHVRPTPAEAAMHEALLAYARRVWSGTHDGHGGRLAVAVLARRASSSAGALVDSLERRLASLAAGQPFAQQLPMPFSDPGDDPPAAVLAVPGLRDPDEERHLLRAVLALARVAAGGESKPDVLARLLRRTSEPLIVFTEYRDTLDRLLASFAAHGPIALHGALARAERREAIRRFTGGGSRLLLATDAASEGLNLHRHCRAVVHLELPWTPLRLEQRVGRVDRIGQTRRVHAIHLVAAGTSEERVLVRLRQRMTRIHDALDMLREGARTEADIAGAVFDGDNATPAATAAVTRPPGVLVPDLRQAALREARRLDSSRALGASEPPHPRLVRARDARPAMTSIRRHGGIARCCWVLVHRIVDTDGQVIWDHLIGLQADTDGPAPGRPDDIRRLLRLDHRDVRRAIDRARTEQLDRLRARQAVGLALALRREHALMRAIDIDHGRLARTLLQPGLFDRRVDRAAAAQAVIRDQALAACRARMGWLERLQVPVSGSCDPALLVILG